MSKDAYVFQFNLEEALYLDSEKGIAEIISIALDPDISIQAFHDYYSIRGVILLNGKYLQTEDISNEHIPANTFKRNIEKNIDLGDGMAEFGHRFPVEISLPVYRVTDLDDVKVSIISFDYELANPQEISIKATIGIQGIEDDRPSTEWSDNTIESLDTSLSTDEPVDLDYEKQDLFSYQVMKKPDIGVEKEVFEPERETDESVGRNESASLKVKADKELDDSVEEVENIVQHSESPEAAEETVENDNKEKVEKDRMLLKKEPQSLHEFLETDSSPSTYNQENDLSVEQYNSDKQVNMLSNELKEVVDDEDMERETVESVDAYFLSDLTDSEADTYSQMRLYIVQIDDTLESIAERYKTTSLHIMKQNRLENETISTGQLLYIPFKKK